MEVVRFEDALLGLGSAFVVGFCRFDFLESLEKLFGIRY